MSTFSDNLLILRKKRGISQKAASEESGVAFRSYRRYEAGEREPSLSIACILADFYGVTLDQLAGRAPLPEEKL
ncbi:MAG: helix-turn-helix transcriptional regulator [Oscillibacter sp.]|nr:helix-turn-helix transcriptional regulator [Oscillibacter sp.]